MTTEVEDIKGEIAGLAGEKTTRRYPPGLRQRIIQLARARIAGGVSRTAVCRELDIGAPTMKRFLESTPVRAAFNRVRVVARRDAPLAPSRTFSVKGPAGTSVEGMALSDVADLFKRLSCLD